MMRKRALFIKADITREGDGNMTTVSRAGSGWENPWKRRAAD